jgi:phage terminase Nu1 subunit (DNA packaging protein)
MNMQEVLTQAAIAEIIGASQQAVSDIEGRGICSRDMPLGVWLLAYIRNLREQAAGRLAAGDLDLATERAGLAKAQRERIEMQNAVTRRELAPVFLLEEVLASAGAKVAAILDAIPGAIRRRNQNLTAADIQTIAGEIAKARNIAAAITLDDLEADSRAAAVDIVSDE